jgi:zinc transport system substrate-binding protein
MVFLAGGALLLFSCGEPARPRTLLAASIPPLASLTGQVAGSRFEVFSLLPPGRSPHDYEPTPGEVDRLRGAVLFVHVHPHLDGWMVRAARSAMGENAPALSMAELPAATGRDPHLWLDMDVVRAFLPKLAERLGELDPPAAPTFIERSRAVLDSLEAFDDGARRILSPKARVPFALLHPAFETFVRRYGMNLVAVLVQRPEEEPLPRTLGASIEALRAAGAPVVFSEPQLAGRVAEAVAADLGARVALLDPQGGPGIPGRETYFDLLRWNVAQLAGNLDASR